MDRNFKIIIGLCLIGLTSAQVSETDQIYDQLFKFPEPKMKSPILKPVETLTLLKRLQELYTNPVDQISQQRKEKVDKLVSESEFNSDSCRKPSINWSHLAKQYENYFKSLSPYLNHVKQQRFAFCQQEFVADLNDDLTRLTTQEIEEINQLRTLVQAKSCRKLEDLYSFSDQGMLAEAILDYMQQYSRHDLDAPKNRKNEISSEEVEQVVGALCRRIDQTLNARVKITYFYTSHEAEKLDKASLDWITNTRVCHAYLEQTSNVLKKIVDLSVKGNTKSLSDRLKECVRPKYVSN